VLFCKKLVSGSWLNKTAVVAFEERLAGPGFGLEALYGSFRL
jgi:hypothetical protein